MDLKSLLSGEKSKPENDIDSIILSQDPFLYYITKLLIFYSLKEEEFIFFSLNKESRNSNCWSWVSTEILLAFLCAHCLVVMKWLLWLQTSHLYSR